MLVIRASLLLINLENFEMSKLRPKRLSNHEIFGIWFWLMIAASPLAVRLYYESMAAFISYASTGVGLIAVATCIFSQAQQVIERNKKHCPSFRAYVVFAEFNGAVFTAALALACCLLVNMLIGNFASAIAVFVGIVLGAVVSYFGMELTTFRDALLVAAWLSLANLAVVLFCYNLVWSSALYSSVLLLWTYNNVLESDVYRDGQYKVMACFLHFNHIYDAKKLFP